MTATGRQREAQILDLIRRDPMISQQALADRLGLSRSAVAGHIMRLHQKGQILGKGYVFPEENTIIVAGGINADILGQSAAPLRAGDSNPGEIREAPGGVARNIAENLARLGNNVRLISAVGQDSRGGQLLEHTRSSGVDISAVRQSSTLPTSSYLAISDHNGQLQSAVADTRVIDELTPEVLQAHLSVLLRASVMVIDSNLPVSAVKCLSSHAKADKEQGPVLFADAVSGRKAEKLQPFLSQLHTLKVNTEEASVLTAISPRSPDFSRQVIEHLLGQGVCRVLLSRGSEEVILASPTRQVALTPPNISVINENGAGDALMAGLVHGWCQNWDMEQQLRFALGCAALTLTVPEANHPQLSVEQAELWINTNL